MNAALKEVEPATPIANAKEFILVTHPSPDTDAFGCLYVAQKFVVGNNPYRIVFMADEPLTDEEVGDAEVLYMDAGGGDLDQHGQKLERSSSCDLLCYRYGLNDDPGIEAILEMTRMADNDERIPPTSVHHILGGLRRRFTTNGETDWSAVCDTAFLLLDILYEQASARFNAAERFAAIADRAMTTLDNGLRLAFLPKQGGLKEAARDAGADVVLFTSKVKGSPHQFTYGIQAGRDVDLSLRNVASALRFGEARRRKVPAEQLKDRSYATIGGDKLFGGLYLHETERLIVNGTPKHELIDDEFTLLNEKQVLEIVKLALAHTSYTRR